MPPPPPGGTKKKKKKGHTPKHQNSFAFRHNPGSKKTDKILSSPNVGVCRRCYDKIEWRKKYRKYKPRTQPGKCNVCFQKNVLAAYHTICTKCAGSDKAIAAMEKRQGDSSSTAVPSSAESAAASESNATSVNRNIEQEKEIVKSLCPVAPNNEKTTSSSNKRRNIRVCACCAAEPALSKYSDASAEDMDIVEQLNDLEDTLESGISEEDGHKLTLREIKGLERKIEKLQGELKERGKKNKVDGDGEKGGGEEEEGEDDGAVDDDESDGDNDDEQESVEGGGKSADPSGEAENDPFLLATGGKALVGDEYQRMLLMKEQTQK